MHVPGVVSVVVSSTGAVVWGSFVSGCVEVCSSYGSGVVVCIAGSVTGTFISGCTDSGSVTGSFISGVVPVDCVAIIGRFCSVLGGFISAVMSVGIPVVVVDVVSG